MSVTNIADEWINLPDNSKLAVKVTSLIYCKDIAVISWDVLINVHLFTGILRWFILIYFSKIALLVEIHDVAVFKMK